MDFYNKGNELFIKELYEEAEEEYTKAIDQKKDIDFLLARSNCRNKLKKYKGAFTDAMSAIRIDKDNYLAYYRKGYFFYYFLILEKHLLIQVNMKQLKILFKML